MKINDNRPIGIYDSGFGGLTVWKQVRAIFPNEHFIYIADRANAPFGNKSTETLRRINDNMISFLLDQNIKLLIVACNTSCALLFSYIKKQLHIPVIDLIQPACTDAIKTTKSGRIAVLSTLLTRNSHAYQKQLTSLTAPYDRKYKVLEVPCHYLVPIIEHNLMHSEYYQHLSYYYIDQALNFGADTLIYGCSHYPYFHMLWKRYSGKRLSFIDPAEGVPYQLKCLIDTGTVGASDQNKEGKTQFYVSRDIQSFKNFLKTFHTNITSTFITAYQPAIHKRAVAK